MVIEPKEAETMTAGGLYIPDNAKEKPQQGIIVAVGPGAKDEPMEVKVGETVLYGKYAGTAAGLGVGGHFWYKFSKFKKDEKFIAVINDSARSVIEGLAGKIEDFKVSSEELGEEIPRLMKKCMNAGGMLILGGIIALGFGIGAIGDSIANHFLKNKADNKTQDNKS